MGSSEIVSLSPQSTITDVGKEMRHSIRDAIESEVESSFQQAGIDAEVVEVFVYGSWANGTATKGESDLDVRVVVDCDSASFATVAQIEDSVRARLVDKLPDDSPFAYVDPKCVKEGSEAATGNIQL